MPWRVSAGWAIDLFLGGERREHDDLELAVPADRFGEIAAALPELDFHVVTRGIAAPVAESAELMETIHQTWGLDRAANRWRVDVFREPFDDDGWVARRDESIRLPYSELIEHTPEGIPYERPEVVLLFKAKHSRRRTRRISPRCCRGYRPSGARCSRTGSSACTRVTSGSTTFAPELSPELEPRRRRGAPRAARRPCCRRRRPHGSRGSPSP